MKRKALTGVILVIVIATIALTILGILLPVSEVSASILSVSLERKGGAPLSLNSVPIGEVLVLSVKYRTEAGPKSNREMEFVFTDSKGRMQQDTVVKTLSRDHAIASIRLRLLSGMGEPNSIKVILRVKDRTAIRTASQTISYTPKKKQGKLSFWAGGTNNMILVDSFVHDWPGRVRVAAEDETESFADLSVVMQGYCLFAGEQGTAISDRACLNESHIQNISPPNVRAMSAISGVTGGGYYSRAAGLVFAAVEEGGSWDVLRTTDIGKTWSSLELFNKLDTPSVKIEDLDSPTAEVVWAVGQRGLVARTDDGGRTWIKQTVLSGESMLKIEAEDEDAAWAVDDDGVLFATTNAGGVWSTLHTPSSLEGVLDVSCTGSRHIWALGRNGNVARSDEPGKWLTAKHPGPKRLNAIAAADDQRAFVVGNELTVFATDDGGVSWRQITDVGPDPNVRPEEALYPDPTADLLTVGVALDNPIEIDIHSL